MTTPAAENVSGETRPSIEDALSRSWDAVVVGAGPAGSAAAWGIARRGASALLIDRGTFPRAKVCGCCLGPLGVNSLREMGVFDGLSARDLRTLELTTSRRTQTLGLPGVVTVSREELDLALVEAAADQGVATLLGVAARIEGGRVTIGSRALCSRVVVDARGLRPDPRSRNQRRTMVGFGATVCRDMAPIEPSTLRMVVGRSGYLGLAPLEDGRLAIGAAVRADAIRSGGRSPALGELLRLAGVVRIDETITKMRGVPQLRTRLKPQDGSVFRVGDAARFVEPITGEGMGWALAGGLAVAPLALRSIVEPDAPLEWPAAHAALLRRSFSRCAAVSALVRWPGATSAALRAMSVLPRLRDGALARATGRSGAIFDPVGRGA